MALESNSFACRGFAHSLSILAVSAFLLALAPEARAAEGPAESLELVRAMVEAHGGMERWQSAPSIHFEDHFKSPAAETGRTSRVMVEQGSRRAYLDFPGLDMRLGWDGENAWSVGWDQPYPPRFMALLNYHFLNLPWLALDPGVRLSEPSTDTLFDDPVEYRTVTITYEESAGDTPRDYYRLYIHPKTHRLRACEYIVTYRALLPEGVDQTPPNTLIYEDFETVQGLVLPTRYTIYTEDHSVFATCEITNWDFSRPFDTSRLEMPEGAVLDTSQP